MSAAEPADSERRRRLLQAASAAAFLAIAAVLVLIVVEANKSSGGDAGNVGQAGEVRQLLAGIPQRGLTLGDPAASTTLVEFGDLQCPVCKGFAEDQVENVIKSRVRSGGARIEFRNYVIIGGESKPAGAAALAAGEQGRGWNFIELFYRNQGVERSGYVSDEFLTAIARKAGVDDLERWNRERKSERLLAEVEASTEEAESLGFEGTPSFAVEGPATEGLEAKGFLESTGDLESALDSALG